MRTSLPNFQCKHGLNEVQVSAQHKTKLFQQDQISESTQLRVKLREQKHNSPKKCTLGLLALILIVLFAISYILFRSCEVPLAKLFSIVSPKKQIEHIEPKQQKLQVQEEGEEQDRLLRLKVPEEKKMMNSNQQQFNNYFEGNQQKQSPSIPAKLLYCIVSASPAPSEQHVIKHFRTIEPLLNDDGKIIYFADREVNFDTRDIRTPNSNIKVLSTHGSIVENIYDAVINHCERHSLVFLLDYNQLFGGKDFITTVKQSFLHDQGCFAFAVPIVFSNEAIKPDSQMANIKQIDLETNLNILQNIENTLRCFQSDLFRMIPHWDLHDTNRKFYNRKLSFLLPILELGFQNGNSQINQVSVAVPNKLILLDQSYIKGGIDKAVLSKGEVGVYTKKMKYNSFQRILRQRGLSLATKFPEKSLSVIGSSLSNLYRIPKIIHQIWLNGEIPACKKYFMAHNIALNPSYKYKLWRMEDINLKNFPITYFYLKKLLKIDKNFEYSRLAMISDIMRYELIYHEGGFYIDTNYMLFKSLDQYLPYKMFVPGAESEYNRVYLSNGIFGAVAKASNIKRLLTKESLQSIDLHAVQTNRASGPYYFKRVINLKDQDDMDIKIIPFQEGYPVYPWHFDDIKEKNKCVFNKYEKIPQQIFKEHSIDLETTNYKILSDCNKIYPYAVGIDFFEFGGSWVQRRKVSSP